MTEKEGGGSGNFRSPENQPQVSEGQDSATGRTGTADGISGKNDRELALLPGKRFL